MFNEAKPNCAEPIIKRKRQTTTTKGNPIEREARMADESGKANREKIHTKAKI